MVFIFDSEKLISEVQTRPALWDLTCGEYHNKHLRMRTWESVAESLIENYGSIDSLEKSRIYLTLIRKWKNIRDSYFRELNNQKLAKGTRKQKKVYVYYDRLSFLESCGYTPHSKRKVERYIHHETGHGSNVTENEDDSTPLAEREEKPAVPVDTRKSASTATRKRTRDDLKISDIRSLQNSQQETCQETPQVVTNSSRQDKEKIDNEDPDKLFLLSLLPDIKKVREDDRLEMKCEIMNVVGKWKRQQEK